MSQATQVITTTQRCMGGGGRLNSGLNTSKHLEGNGGYVRGGEQATVRP